MTAEGGPPGRPRAATPDSGLPSVRQDDAEPLNRRRTLFESRSPWQAVVKAACSPMTSPTHSSSGIKRSSSAQSLGIKRSSSTHSLGSSTQYLAEQKNPRYGSLTDAERGGRLRSPPPEGTRDPRDRLAPPPKSLLSDNGADDREQDGSMSLAAVESIQPKQRPAANAGARSDKLPMMAGGMGVPASSNTRLLNSGRQRVRAVRARLCSPDDASARLVIVFMTALGLASALLTFAMDVAVEKLYNLRVDTVLDLRQFGTLTSHGWAALSSLAWIGHGVFWGALAIWLTARISPLAAGSGIPEIKSILSGNVLYKYLSKRTLVAKVLGLTCALASGLPLGKEGPFIHASCCLCELLLSTPLFRELKLSHATRTQMLMAACSVGVGANFGAPVGGVLLAIELTSTYFLVSIYWKCFYTAVTGAVLSRTLYMAYKTKTHVLSATFQAFFEAEDVETDVIQLPAFITIGILSGLLGALFVKVNAKWGAFRARHASSAFFKSKYYLALVLLVLWGLLTMPSGPIGSFMHKSQMGSLAELFREEELGAEWGQNERELIWHLLCFFVLRLSFTCIGITLPMPCGVFAPSLCAGAGLGRVVGEVMRSALPNHPTSAGGYAVLGAAALAAGTTHTISSAVLMFELTGGIKHALPMLVTVVVSYMTARSLSPSIFDSILMMKKLPFLPEFKNKASYYRPAREVLAHLVERSDDLRRMAKVINVMRGEQSSAFALWRAKAERARRRRSKKPFQQNAAVGPTAVVKVQRGGGCSPTHVVYRSMTIADLEHLLAACTWTFLPWVEESTQLLLGAIRRSAIKQLVEARKRKYHLNERVVLSQRFAAQRACNSLHNELTAAGLATSAAPARGGSSAKVGTSGAAPQSAITMRTAQWREASTPSPSALPPAAEAPSGHSPQNRIERAVRSSLKQLRTVDIRSLLRSRPQRTMMDEHVVELEPAFSSMSESIIDQVDSTTDLSLAIEDVQSMFGGGQSAPPAVISVADGPGDLPLADGEAKAIDAELAPAPLSESAMHGLPQRHGLGQSAALRTSLTTLSESSVQLELDRSQWQAIDTPDGLQLTCTLADYLDVPLSDEDWRCLQVEEAPFCIAASASMGQVHFYFSMLSLSCAFVTDHGKYVGMISKTDIAESGL